MRDPSRRISRVLGVTAILLGVQLAIFSPQWSRGDHLVPVSTGIIPPWSGVPHQDTVPQDRAGTDKTVFVMPNLVHWCRSVRQDPGGLLWNPNIFCGTPFLATQDTFALYPLNALFLMGSPAELFLWWALLHGWLASIFAYMAVRRLGLSMSPSLVAAVIYGGSGWFLAHHDIPNFVQAATWVPLVIWGVDVAVRDRRWRGVFAAAVGLALGVLAGMIQITLIGLLLAGLLALLRGVVELRRQGATRSISGLAMALLAVVLGLSLAAPQLLPSLEIAPLSGRYEVDLASMKAAGSAPWELSGLLLPELLGNAPELDRLQRGEDALLPAGTSEESFAWARLTGVGGFGASLMERIFYPGMVAVLVMLVALFARPDPRVLLALAIAALGFLGAAGTGVLDLLHHLPGFDLGSPRRLLLLAVCGMALLAALGIERLVHRACPRPAALLSGLVVLGLAGGLATCIFAEARVDAWMAEQLGDPTPAFGIGAWTAEKIWPGLVAGSTALALLLLLAGRWPRALVAALLSLLAAEFAWLNHRLNPGQPPSTTELREPALVAALRADATAAPEGRGFRIVRYRDPENPGPFPPLPPNLASLFGILDMQGYEGLVNRRIEELAALVDPSMPRARHLIAEITRRAALDSPILDLMRVRHVLATGVFPLRDARSQSGAGDIEIVVEEAVAAAAEPETLVPATLVQRRHSALGIAQLPARLLLVDDDRAALKRLGRPDFDPRAAAVMLRRDARKLGLDDAAGEIAFAPDSTEVVCEVQNVTCLRLRFRSAEPALLLLAETWHPGWQAEIAEGIPLPIARADHAFRALLLPAGEGEVILRFRPRSFAYGIAAAILGLFVLIGGGVLSYRRRQLPEVRDS